MIVADKPHAPQHGIERAAVDHDGARFIFRVYYANPGRLGQTSKGGYATADGARRALGSVAPGVPVTLTEAAQMEQDLAALRTGATTGAVTLTDADMEAMEAEVIGADFAQNGWAY